MRPVVRHLVWYAISNIRRSLFRFLCFFTGILPWLTYAVLLVFVFPHTHTHSRTTVAVSRLFDLAPVKEICIAERGFGMQTD